MRELVNSGNVDLQSLLRPVLDEAIRLTGFDKGNVQLLDRAAGNLLIVSQRGFDAAFLETFARVAADTSCACGRALKEQRPIFIADVETDAAYAPYRAAASEAGYRSVLSVPIKIDGEVIGMVSVHHRQPQSVSPADIAHLGEFAARLIMRESLLH
jgi:GAF domain-containing protein